MNVRAAISSGWKGRATCLLPDSDWQTYYDPLARRLDELRPWYPEATELIDQVGAEIAIRTPTVRTTATPHTCS